MKSKAAFIYLPTGLLWIVLNMLSGCTPSKKMYQDYNYFQKNLDTATSVQVQEPVIKNGNILKIQVLSNTLNQEQASLFNQPGYEYVVDPSGEINLPLIGNVRAAGYTRTQLQSQLQKTLSSYIKSPLVTVRLRFSVNVLGEVRSPGVKDFTSEKVTIIDAISAANDLTDFARRQDIMVIREQDKVRKYYQINLKTGEVFQSPAYYLEPNDIVYVGANVSKLRSLNSNPIAQRNFQLGLSIVSVVTTVIFLLRSFK